MKIRKAELADAAVVTEFNLRLAEETESLKLDPDCVSAGVAALLSDPAKGLYFVAEQDNRICGQVMITYEWSDWRNGNIWWLQSVYVRQECRGSGVFRALFEHVRTLAAAHADVWGLRLYMHAENERARGAYEKLGMTHTQYEVFELDLSGKGGT